MKIIHEKDLKKEYTDERCYIEEIFNTESFENLSIARATVETGISTQLHALKNTNEWYYLLEGKGEIEINGETAIVEKGSCIYIPANDSQRITNIGTERLSFLCICNKRFQPESYVNLE